MRRSVVQTLIFRDWHRHQPFILLSLLGGVLALGLVQVGGELPTILGSTWFFVSLIVLGSMLPVNNVINERKKQTLPFLLSLPISVGQYTAAKLVSTVGMFLVPWTALVVAASSFIAGHRNVPHGIIPLIVVLATLTFVGFCVIAGVALVSESEGGTIAATVATNSLYGFGWYLLIRNRAIQASIKNQAAVWQEPLITIFLVEIAAIVA